MSGYSPLMQSNYFFRRREQLRLTQRAIALAMEMTTTAVSNWERGENLPRPDLYDSLARAYRTTPEAIAVEVYKLARTNKSTAAA